jgi:hypothetical protein
MVVFPLAFPVAHSKIFDRIHQVVPRSQDRLGTSGLMDRLAFPGGKPERLGRRDSSSAGIGLTTGHCGRDHALITIAGIADDDGAPQKIKIAWSVKARSSAAVVDRRDGSETTHNERLIQSIVRAHGWMHSLQDGAYESIEQLAEANSLHPKVVRQALRLAFQSHLQSWKACTRKGFRWRKSQNCFRCRGQRIVPCSADFSEDCCDCLSVRPMEPGRPANGHQGCRMSTKDTTACLYRSAFR